MFASSIPVSNKISEGKNIESIMYVGNSFFYYNNSLHNNVSSIVKNHGLNKTLRQRSITINGSSLSWHPLNAYLSNKNIGSFTIDTANNNKYKQVKDTSIDAVIFMDCSLCPIHPKTKGDFHKNVTKYTEIIRSRGMEPILFMSWPYKNKPSMIKELRKEFLKAAKKNNIYLIPVGEAFYAFQKKYPEINLYTDDFRYPSKEGTYLAAAVTFASLFNLDLTGTKGINGIDADVAHKIHEMADSTAQSFFN
tara:strand:+ start:85 stop:834 length:750 start_codon:yes stop_codon:yes gene_type:complete